MKKYRVIEGNVPVNDVREVVAEIESDRDEARDRCAKLEAALKPFAKLGDLFSTTWGNTPDDYEMQIGPFKRDGIFVVVRDLRAASAALEPGK